MPDPEFRSPYLLKSIVERNKINYDEAIRKSSYDIRMDEEYEVSVIIPVRGRKKNTNFIIPYLCKLLRDSSLKISLTVVEYDSISNYNSLCKDHNINYIFVPEMEKRFWKALIQNIGALLNRKSKYYMFYDVDCIVPLDFFSKIESYISMGVETLQPYSGRRIFSIDQNLSTQIRNGVVKIFEITTTMSGIIPNNPMSTGGIVMVRKDIFERVGGYDAELFWDYSPEDDFFFEKCKNVSKITFADNIDVYHLYHKPQNNRNRFIITMSAYLEYLKHYEDIRTYINKNYKMRLLHLTGHEGCKKEIKYISSIFNMKLTELDMNLGEGCAKFNMGKDRANRFFEHYKNIFSEHDIILISDTSPQCRVLLQNSWTKPVLVWICNRFDYSDESSNDCKFPDPEYYALFKSMVDKPNYQVFGYTPFENEYARIRGCDIGNKFIKPSGGYAKPCISDKLNSFFVGSYHNDNIMMDLPKKLRDIGLNVVNGRYDTVSDLTKYKAIIHIPYAWSNLALFECWNVGIIYFIPSLSFLNELRRDRDFFWSPPFIEKYLHFSEWYNPEHSKLFVYFDSWDDLKQKTETTDYELMKDTIINFSKNHRDKTLKSWEEVLRNSMNF